MTLGQTAHTVELRHWNQREIRAVLRGFARYRARKRRQQLFDSGLVKVLFIVDLPDDEPPLVESLWATQVGDDLYQIDNLPFFADGYGLNDIVRARIEDSDDHPALVARELAEDMGHGLLRLHFDEPILAAGPVQRLRWRIEMALGKHRDLNPDTVGLLGKLMPGRDRSLLMDLSRLGCAFESANLELICVDVSPGADRAQVGEFLYNYDSEDGFFSWETVKPSDAAVWLANIPEADWRDAPEAPSDADS